VTRLDRLWFDAHDGDDWCALHRGSWAIPEGTRAEWIRILNAIEHGAQEAFGDNHRLAMQRLPDGRVRLYSPRNCINVESGSTEILAKDVQAFLAMVRRELEAAS
jgi:hypothetical protein